MNNLEEAVENFRIIYNKAWALFSGVKPMTREEALEMVREMKPIIDPRIIFFAYFNEEPIGFFITVPDQVLRTLIHGSGLTLAIRN